MTGDLGAWAAQVHAKAREVLDFWFALPSEKHFSEDDGLDHEITARFGNFVDDLIATDATHCWTDPDTLLGAVIAIDQFSRNIHRGGGAAFVGDEIAQRLTSHAIGAGWDEGYPPERRAFLYMPLMHAEDLDMQQLCVERFTALGEEENLRYAREHAEVIGRFGRFPSRNAALGRTSTPDEVEYLSRPDAGW